MAAFDPNVDYSDLIAQEAAKGVNANRPLLAAYETARNAKIAGEGLGYALTLDKLINTTGSRLCFRPLAPRLEIGMYLVWKKYQVFSPIAEKFLEEIRDYICPL